MLHIINHYPVEPSELEQTSYGDTVLFIENAIFAAKQSYAANNFFKKTFAHLNFCVLGKDMKVRGVDTAEILCGFSIIDERDFRDIAENSIAIKSWN